MIHVIVVDDEPPIADGLTDLLRDAFGGELSVKACYSAAGVTRCLGSEPIDLVIADINMPGMTGLELAARLREEFSSVKVILLTGYSRFDYVYEANQLGGVLYLLKTADDAAIVGSVRRAIDELLDERSQTRRTDQLESLAMRLEPMVQRDFIERIVRDEGSGPPLGQKEIDAAGVGLDVGMPILPLVASGAETDPEQLVDRVRVLIGKALGGEASAVIGEVAAWVGVVAVVLQPTTPLREPLRDVYVRWLSTIERRHRETTLIGPDGLNIVVNESFIPFSSVGAAVRRLLSLCGFLYRGLSSVYTPEGAMRARLDEGRSVSGLSIQVIASIEAAFVSMDWDRYSEEVGRLLAAAERSATESVWVQHQYRLGLRFVCSTIIDRLPRSLQLLRVEEKLISATETDAALTDVAHEYRVIFDELVRLRAQTGDDYANSHPVKLALVYMNEKLHADLSVTSIAEHLSLSPGHLSRMFKAEVGHTILDHISDLRFERARFLLLNTNMRVRDVASQVGLTSTDYFIRFFRRRAGVPPQQYRDTHRHA